MAYTGTAAEEEGGEGMDGAGSAGLGIGLGLGMGLAAGASTETLEPAAPGVLDRAAGLTTEEGKAV